MPALAQPKVTAESSAGVHQRPLSSRAIHRLGELSASSSAAILAAAVSLAFIIAAVSAPDANPWLTAFESLAAAVTLVMVFALQHSQAVQQIAVQRKLDEILRVLPGANEKLVHFETESLETFDAVDELHSEIGARARAEEAV